MSFELDHVFIATSEPGLLEQALSNFGIEFTRRSVHQGQGTANACAVFDNAFLEILWRADQDEVRSEVVRPLGLDERIGWQNTGASPFGISFRPTEPGANWPFDVWQYAPPYAVSGIPIVTPPGSLADPLVFLTIRPRAAGSNLPWRDAPLHHGARRLLTRVTVQRPNGSPVARAVRWFVEQELFTLEQASEHGLELEWDGGRQGQSFRFATKPCIVLRW